MTTAGCGGNTQTGRFGGGMFTLRQPRAGRDPAHSRRLDRLGLASRRVRKLWGRDRGGRFRTHGRHSQATVLAHRRPL